MAYNSYHVLHLVLMKLRPGVDAAQRGRLIDGWSALGEMPGVLHLGAVPQSGTGSTHDLALFSVVSNLLAMEAFGTDTRHMAFLQEHFIPALHSFAAADLFLASPPPSAYDSAFCFLFNVEASIYDWQVRAALAALHAGSDAIAISAGTAIDQRQRYRAGGILFFATAEAAAAYIEGGHFERVRTEHRSVIAQDPAFLWGPACVLRAPAA